MISAVQPLRWWNDHQLHQWTHHLAAHLRTWQQAWGLPTAWPGASHVQAERAWQVEGVADVPWQAADNTVHPSLWWADGALLPLRDAAESNPVLHTLAHALFGHADEEGATGTAFHPADIAPELARGAWDDLWHHLALDGCPRHVAAEGGLQDPVALAHLLRPWSGGVTLSLPWLRGHTLRVLLAGSAVEQTFRPLGLLVPKHHRTGRPAVTSLWEAVSNLPCLMRVELNATQVTLGELRHLQVGDVLEVPHLLDEPLLAVSEHGVPIAQAYLGKHLNHKAIELLGKPR